MMLPATFSILLFGVVLASWVLTSMGLGLEVVALGGIVLAGCAILAAFLDRNESRGG